MSPEDFTNPDLNSHPEVPGDSLELQSPEQVTMRHLLHEVTERTRNGVDNDGYKDASLFHPTDETISANISRIEKGSRLGDPSRVAKIQLRETVNDNNGRLITNYFILDTPKGLQMEKHLQIANDKKILGQRATQEDAEAAGVRFLKKQAALEKAKLDEKRQGFNFVSENDARDLLERLTQLVPFEPQSE